MGYILGIDLGTTNSCVCIPPRSGRFTAEAVEVIPDRHGRKVTPSVVVENSQGQIIVGYAAKSAAGLHPKPIFFIKRFMGTNHRERLLGREMRPEEISAEILKYLQKLAAEHLQVPETEVRQAIICVPAYFDLNQSQATKEAGRLAGLEVLAILMEPIAAALAYGQDQEDNLNIFCYDLGGGTFDATVLEKRHGEYRVLAFGGDPFLGGVDFDKLLANYLIDQVKDKYSLDLDHSKEEDEAIYLTFLQVAEKYKHRLSDEYEVMVREVNLRDKEGNPIILDLILSRSQFEALIRGQEDPDLEILFREYQEKGFDQAMTHYLLKQGFQEEDLTPETLKRELDHLEREVQHREPSIKKTRYLSMLALMKSGLYPQEIHEVIMVGGSSHIPLVKKELQELFGKVPKLIDPDTIVAKGAALKAALLARSERGVGGLKFLDLPEKTFLEDINLFGVVDAPSFGKDPAELRVRLRREPDFEAVTTPRADGHFEFRQVELLPDCSNHFMAQVESSQGQALATFEFAILQEMEGEPGIIPPPPPDFITKRISIETTQGLMPVFEAGEVIPNRKLIKAKTSDQSGLVRVPIFEGAQARGEIRVENLDPTLPVGTPVDISLEVKATLEIHGVAMVYGEQARTGEVVLKIDNLELPTMEELQQELERLRERFYAALEVTADPNEKMRQQRLGRERLAQLEREMQQPVPTRPRIASLLLDLEFLVRKLETAKVLQPPLEEFQEKIKTAYQLDKNHKYSLELQNLQEEGEKAYKSKNERLWSEVNKSLDNILSDLAEPLAKSLSPLEKAMGGKMLLIEEVQKLAQLAQEKGIYGLYRQKLEELHQEVQNIDVFDNPEEALERIIRLYHTKYKKLEHELKEKPDTSLITPR